MANVIQCDRCGAIVPQNWASTIKQGERTINLCSRCIACFNEWMDDIENLDYNYDYMIAAPRRATEGEEE